VKKLLLYTFLLIYTCIGVAQNRKLDSLNKIYNDKNAADSNRLKALQTIAWSYTSENPDTAIFLAEEELKLIKLIPEGKRKRWTAKVYNTIGSALSNKGKFTKALEYFLQTLKLYEELKNKEAIGGSYGYIGMIYFEQSNYPKALEYYLKSLKIAEETGDKKGIENCYSNIGNLYLNQADYDKAVIII
jgi:tetratricopeptide (TPR) repeat protein